MARQVFSPGALHPAPGFNHVAVADGSRTVYFAGQIALDKEFNVVGGDDLRAQTEAAMRNLEIAIAAADVRWEDIVRRTIYTTRPTEFQEITAGIEAVTGPVPHPAQTIIGVTGLALDGLLIEIECTASIA
ncbi:MAG: RidA family protein [Solirubrobacteraceae bacterium]